MTIRMMQRTKKELTTIIESVELREGEGEGGKWTEKRERGKKKFGRYRYIIIEEDILPRSQISSS